MCFIVTLRSSFNQIIFIGKRWTWGIIFISIPHLFTFFSSSATKFICVNCTLIKHVCVDTRVEKLLLPFLIVLNYFVKTAETVDPRIFQQFPRFSRSNSDRFTLASAENSDDIGRFRNVANLNNPDNLALAIQTDFFHSGRFIQLYVIQRMIYFIVVDLLTQ